MMNFPGQGSSGGGNHLGNNGPNGPNGPNGNNNAVLAASSQHTTSDNNETGSSTTNASGNNQRPPFGIYLDANPAPRHAPMPPPTSLFFIIEREETRYGLNES